MIYAFYACFVAWLLWSIVRDGLGIIALEDIKRYAGSKLAVVFPSLLAFIMALALLATDSVEWRYFWPLMLGYFACLAFYEIVTAKVKNEIKQVHSTKSGLKMPYRAPVSIVIVVLLLVRMPDSILWLMAAPFALAAIVALIGNLDLRTATYEKPVEKKAAKKA